MRTSYQNSRFDITNIYISIYIYIKDWTQIFITVPITEVTCI